MIEKYIEIYRRNNRIKRYKLEHVTLNLKDLFFTTQDLDITGSVLFVDKFTISLSLPINQYDLLQQDLFEIQSGLSWDKLIKYGNNYDPINGCNSVLTNVVNFVKRNPAINTSYSADLVTIEFNKISEHIGLFRYVPSGIILFNQTAGGEVFSFIMNAYKLTVL